MVKTLSQRSLVFPIRDGRVLLGLKKKSLGEGNFNGFGGKFDSSLDNNILYTAKRELEEECGLVCSVKDLEKVAVIDFYFPFNSKFNQCVHVYFLRTFEGVPSESDEMRPEWFSLDSVPYSKMWDSDRIWLKELMCGKKLVGEFYWKSDNKTVDSYTLREVDSF